MNKWTKEIPKPGFWYWYRVNYVYKPSLIFIKQGDKPAKGYEWCKVEQPPS